MRVESLTSLRVYQDCPQAYEYKYRQEITPPIKSAHFRKGTFVDTLLQKALRGDTSWAESDIPAELAKTTWSDDFDVDPYDDWKVAISITKRVLSFLKMKDWQTCTTKDLWETAMDAQPCVQVELFAEGLHGFVDWIAKDPQGRICLVDFKVSRKQPSPSASIDYDRQLGLYAWLLRKNQVRAPLYLYQLQIFGETPQKPRLVRHKNSTKDCPRMRPETGRIPTTWELWKEVAQECGEDPDCEDYVKVKKYCEEIVWQNFVPCFCPEDVQDQIAENELLWKQKAQNQLSLRNLRNYIGGPCHEQTPPSRRCPFLEPCYADLLKVAPPRWAIKST